MSVAANAESPTSIHSSARATPAQAAEQLDAIIASDPQLGATVQYARAMTPRKRAEALRQVMADSRLSPKAKRFMQVLMRIVAAAG